MRRGPEAAFRLRAFSCHRCSCWLRRRGCFWLCHRCSGRRRARSPSAPRASLGASVRSPARPCGSAGALLTGGMWCALPGHAHLAPVFAPRTAEPPINVACNSPATISNHESAALELQRFQTLLNLCPVELHATFVGGRATQPVGCLHAGGAWWLAPGCLYRAPGAAVVCLAPRLLHVSVLSG